MDRFGTIRTMLLSARIRTWLLAGLAVCTIVLHFDALRERVENVRWGYGILREKGFHHGSPHLNALHEMADAYLSPGTSVHILTTGEKERGSGLRFTQLLLGWHQSFEPVRYGPKETLGEAGAIYAPRLFFEPEPDENGIPKYVCVYERYGWALWLHEESCRPTDEELAARRVSSGREFFGLVCVLVPSLAGFLFWRRWTGILAGVLLLSIGAGVYLLAGIPICVWSLGLWEAGSLSLLYGMRRMGRREEEVPEKSASFRETRYLFLCVSLYMGIIGWFCLSHDFTAPNGLGVFGGRAGLFYRFGGVPEGLFTDCAYRFLEPAYPPGLAMLILSQFGFSGGCAERFPQLLTVLAMGVLLYWLLHAARGSVGKQSLVWAFFLCPTSLAVATNCYAEPFMVLCLLAGLDMVRGGRDDWLGWVFMGAAGWFKNEGLLYFLLLWASIRMCSGRKAAPLRWLVAGLVLPAVWFLGSRLMGAALSDYAPIWTPDGHKSLVAIKAMAMEMFAKPWETAFLYPLLVAGGVVRLVMLRTWNRETDGVTACFIGLSLLSFAGIYGLSLAEDFSWHLYSSVDRLLWGTAMIGWFVMARAAEVAKGGRIGDNPGREETSDEHCKTTVILKRAVGA